MRQLAALALFGMALAGPLTAAAETPATTQILQQRTPDGGILLTDRPRAGATTERSWQVEKEDPVAARRRALDVKAEANLVTERIDRRIAAQQRMADEDALRQGLARLDRERSAAFDQDDAFGGGVPIFTPYRLRVTQRFRAPRGDHGRAMQHPHAAARTFGFRG